MFGDIREVWRYISSPPYLLKRDTTKGQKKSNIFFQSDISSKKQTNKFYFTTMKPQVDLFLFPFLEGRILFWMRNFISHYSTLQSYFRKNLISLWRTFNNYEIEWRIKELLDSVSKPSSFRILCKDTPIHGLRTPNEGMNQRNLKFGPM